MEFSTAMKAAVASNLPSSRTAVAFKADSVDEAEGIIIGKVSVAGIFDRENERVELHALKSATYELVRSIGHENVGVDINHEQDAIKCDVLMAWIGDPMPDPLATYVALRPHDKTVFEAAKAGEIVGMSWSGPYLLREAE
jgi:hypothetical protein